MLPVEDKVHKDLVVLHLYGWLPVAILLPQYRWNYLQRWLVIHTCTGMMLSWCYY